MAENIGFLSQFNKIPCCCWDTFCLARPNVYIGFVVHILLYMLMKFYLFIRTFIGDSRNPRDQLKVHGSYMIY